MEEKFRLLYSWIESWRQENGYGGFLHHAIHGTVNWYYSQLVPSYTYEPLMNGFINLYYSTGNSHWLLKAEACAHDLISILDPINQFKFSGFEFAPKGGSIVHTVNPLFSFLKLYEITKKTEYLCVVKKTLESVICTYWNGHNLSGPFNMTLIVASAFAEYGRITGDWRFHNKYGRYCFDAIIKHKVGPEGGIAEGLYYRNENNHSIIFPWYNVVKAIAMIRYGRAISDRSWTEEGISLLKRIKQLFYQDYTLPHSFQICDRSYNIVNDVRLIAPSALAITWMSQEGIISSEETELAIQTIMNKQTNIGFVPANYGYDWRSEVGVTAWNCFVFEMLTTRYSLLDPSTQPLPTYERIIDCISIFESNEILSFSKEGIIFFSVEKRTGDVKRYPINKYDFTLNTNCLSYHPHLVKLNAQRHYSVAYIDDFGNGCWLEKTKGDIIVWSPFNNLKIKDGFRILNEGILKYEKWSFCLYHIIKPFLYIKPIVNFIMKVIKR